MLLPCFLCACVKGENKMKIELSPEKKSICELVSCYYTEEDLDNIVQFEGTVNALDSQYPVECIRKTDKGYRVSYLSENGIAIIIFDVDGYKISGFTFSLSQPKLAFDSLSEESSLDDVQIIDPNGSYYFLYTGRNDVPRESVHYTTDGYMLTIEYDMLNTITGIHSVLI